MAIELRTFHLGTKAEESDKKINNAHPKTKTITSLFKTSAEAAAIAQVKQATPLETPFIDFQTTLNLPSGVYKGCHQNGIPHGFGVMTFNQNDPDKRKSFNGNYKDGKAHGPGTLVWVNGVTYTGNFREGELTETGLIKWLDGTTYTGCYQNGLPHGFGTMSFKDTDTDHRKTYSGNHKDGKAHGSGILTWTNGVSYEGDFADNVITGKGSIKWKDGTSFKGVFTNRKDKGDFKPQEINGTGILQLPDGTYYEGTFIDGKVDKKGKIKLRFLSGDEYAGEYNYTDGKIHGKGIYIFANGDRYEGDFLQGKMTGQGIKFNANRTIFIGTWKDGKWMGGGPESYKANEDDNKTKHEFAEQFSKQDQNA
jgi:hypothetical protein